MAGGRSEAKTALRQEGPRRVSSNLPLAGADTTARRGIPRHSGKTA
jgi:hypothetical protein